MVTSTAGAKTTWLYRISAVLWGIWGLVHIFAGVMTMKKVTEDNIPEAIHGITSAVELSSLQTDYAPAAGAVLSQHGFNLAWFGVVTFVAAFFVWRKRPLAVYLAALVGGLADLGYFIFIDLGGYATPPGPQMTWICAAAIVTGMVAARSSP